MSHLCTRCKALMCPDCREIAEEYEELLSNWKRANFALEQRIEKMEREAEGNERKRREAA